MNGLSGTGEAVALYRQWQLLACWPPLGTVVGGLGIEGELWPAARQLCSLPATQQSRMGNRGCTWTTPLWFRHARVIWEQLAASSRPRISSPHLPSACHLTPTLSTPVLPHGSLYKNPFPEVDETKMGFFRPKKKQIVPKRLSVEPYCIVIFIGAKRKSNAFLSQTRKESAPILLEMLN